MLFTMKGRYFLTLVALLAAMGAKAAPPEEVLRNPPAEAHVGVWWHWMGGQVSEAGIRKDLDWFQRMGITSATIFGMADTCTPWARRIGNVPTDGLCPYDERWWKLFAFACREGKRRGIDIGLHNCPGYTSTGGPWIPSHLAMRELVFNVTNAAEQISTAPSAEFPVYNEDTRRYECPPCAARRTDVVEIGIARGGIRVAHIPMGAFIQPTDWDTFGLECDKMNPEAVDLHLDHVISELKRHLGDNLPAAGLRHILLDSYEAGTPSWTPKMREEFRNRRGYDPLEFLPILGGFTNLYSAAEVTRFKKDFRETMKELYRDVLFKRMSERLHREGLSFANEPYDGPFQAAQVSPFIDRLMTEFWYDPHGAKLLRDWHQRFNQLLGPNGKRHNIVEAEAFTGAPDKCQWTEMPANLKPGADAAFLAGVNRLIFHTCPLQPWGDEIKPGVTTGRWGTHFGRNQTWGECGKPFFDYLARCQALLQWGEPSDKRLDMKDVRQLARTDGERTLYFVVAKDGSSRFYDEKEDKWLDPVSGTVMKPAFTPTQVMQLENFTPALGDCAKSSDSATRYFSGTRTYRAKFKLAKSVSRARLDFVQLADQLATVRINGRDAGVVWGAPYAIELPVEALKVGENALEIDITNSWHNRLIGDEQEASDCEFEEAPLEGGSFLKAYPDWFRGGIAARPSKGRKCFTTWNYFKKDSALIPSGLLVAPTLSIQELE